MNDEEDRSIRQCLRVVTVLDAMPGRADDAENGTPIGIITLGHRGEVEQPLMLPLMDVRKLAQSLLMILARFGNVAAENILLHHLDGFEATDKLVTVAGSETGGTDSLLGESERPVLPPPRPVPITGVEMIVRFRDRKLDPMVLKIIGGYRWLNDIMLMFKWEQFGGEGVGAQIRTGQQETSPSSPDRTGTPQRCPAQ